MVEWLLSMINEKTPIPLGLVIFVAGLIGGGSAWLTTLQIETSSNGATLSSIEAKEEHYLQAVDQIEKRLSEIEGELKRIRH